MSGLRMLWDALKNTPRERILRGSIDVAQRGNLPIVGVEAGFSPARRELLSRAGASAGQSLLSPKTGALSILKSLLTEAQPSGGVASALEDAAYNIVGDEGKRALWRHPLSDAVTKNIDIDLVRQLMKGQQALATEDLAPMLRSRVPRDSFDDFGEALRRSGVDEQTLKGRVVGRDIIDQDFGIRDPDLNLYEELADLPGVSRELRAYPDALEAYFTHLDKTSPKTIDEYYRILDNPW